MEPEKPAGTCIYQDCKEPAKGKLGFCKKCYQKHWHSKNKGYYHKVNVVKRECKRKKSRMERQAEEQYAKVGHLQGSLGDYPDEVV